MIPFLESIPESLSRVIELSCLVSNCISSYSLLLYGDYTNTREYPVLYFTGWLKAGDALSTIKPLLVKISNDLVPGGITFLAAPENYLFTYYLYYTNPFYTNMKRRRSGSL